MNRNTWKVNSKHATALFMKFLPGIGFYADPNGRAVWGVEPAAACLVALCFRLPPGHGHLSFECGQVEVSASGWSLIQRSPSGCGVSVIVKPWPTVGRRAMGEKQKRIQYTSSILQWITISKNINLERSVRTCVVLIFLDMLEKSL